MAVIDSILENLRMEVELSGKSGADGVYLRNLNFTIRKEDFDYPEDCDFDGAIVDFDWFWKCSQKGISIPCPSPGKSFWIRIWGDKVQPYGYTWRVNQLLDNLSNPVTGRKGVLFNSTSPCDPPATLSYQFFVSEKNRLDITITMRTCDMANVLVQDVTMSFLLLKQISQLMDMDPGDMTFNIADAHVFYESLRITDSYEFDVGL